MRRRFIVLGLALFQSLFVFGQRKTIDSLERVLEVTSDKKQKLDLFIALSNAAYDYDSEKGLHNATEALHLATELNNNSLKRKALTLQGYYYFVEGKYDQSLKLYRQAMTISGPEDPDLAYTFTMTGNLFRVTAAYDSAETYYKRAIHLLVSINSKRYLPYTFKHLAKLYVLQWRNQEAEQALISAMELYESSESVAGRADTYFCLAEVYKNKAEFSKAVAFVDNGCELAEKTADELLHLHCLINQGTIKYRMGEYPRSLQLNIQALGMLKTKDLPLIQTQVYMNIGDVYRALSDNEVALKYYNEALRIAEHIGVKYEIARAYGSIANIYRSNGNFEKSRELNEKSLAIRTEINDPHGISLCYTNQALIFQRQKRYDEAIEYLNRVLELRRKINFREGIPSALYNLASIYAELGQSAKSVKYQQEALALEEFIGNKFTMGFSNNQLGAIYTRLKMYPLAQRHLKRAEQIAREVKSQNLRMTNEHNWSAYFDAIGDKAHAYEHFKNYAASRDSLNNDISAQKLAELQALYTMERMDQEIQSLSQAKEINEKEIALQRAKINQQNIVIVSGLVSLVLVSVLAVVIYNYNRRLTRAHREITEQKEEIQAQSEELIDANQTIAEINKRLEERIEDRTKALSQAYKELDTFFYRSSHDFRRPLTTFLGLAEVAKVTVKDPNALELFEKVRDTAINLDKMLVKLQSISDVGSQQLVYREVFIKDIFETVCDSFRDEIQRKGIKTSADVRIFESFVSYPAMIKIIIENLVENAIHFSGVNEPYIKLKAIQSGDYLTIDIQDNGQGIGPEFREHIFDMYYRANERSKGNGLGLYIVKKAVEKLDGDISMTSVVLEGTTFTIHLPWTKPFS